MIVDEGDQQLRVRIEAVLPQNRDDLLCRFTVRDDIEDRLIHREVEGRGEPVSMPSKPVCPPAQ